MRKTLRTDVLAPLSVLLDGESADTRASLSMAIWMGTTVLRNIVVLEPLSGSPCEMLHARLVKLFAAALSPA